MTDLEIIQRAKAAAQAWQANRKDQSEPALPFPDTDIASAAEWVKLELSARSSFNDKKKLIFRIAFANELDRISN